MSDEAFNAFMEWAAKTGHSQGWLAEECLSSRAHLNQVLRGRRPGNLTWKRIVKVLPMDGLLLLQQSSAWNKHAAAALAQRVEREKLLELGQKCRASMEVPS